MPVWRWQARDTEDAFSAKCCHRPGVAQIKGGSLCRNDWIAKYNRLLEIEQELDDDAGFRSSLLQL
jgi:enolase